MNHFASPFVQGNKCIGCGRYKAFLADEVPSEGYELAEPIIINIGSISQVTTAALILAPDSFNSAKGIYEKKDQAGRLYVGSSVALAYLLALISRDRQIKLNVETDIWCTGSLILLNESTPFLEATMPSGFDIKLNAFVSEENRDVLFISPFSNITPIHESLLERNNIRILSLGDIENFESFEQKVILKVHGNELETLVDTVFKKPSDVYSESSKKISHRKTILMPKEIKTAFKQYVVYFNEFVNITKGKEIYFEVQSTQNGLIVETQVNDENELRQINLYLNEYVGFIKQNIEKLEVNLETNVSVIKKELLLVELKNEIQQLKCKIEVKEIEKRALRETADRFYNLLLDDPVLR